jgi:uncharacterized protein YjbJ (UPF0337 family)
MGENRVTGTAKNVGGKLEEDLGGVTGATTTQAEGIAKQIHGAAQDVYGQARDAVSDMADTTRDTALSFEKLETIDLLAVLNRVVRLTQPCTGMVLSTARMYAARPVWNQRCARLIGLLFNYSRRA